MFAMVKGSDVCIMVKGSAMCAIVKRLFDSFQTDQNVPPPPPLNILTGHYGTA